MKTEEFDRAVFYKADCGCSNDECQLSIMLDHDPEIGDITMEFYHDLKYCSWWKVDRYDFPWIKNVDWQDRFTDWWETIRDYYYRFKGALRLIFTGRIKVEEYFLFKNEEQIGAFINALEEGKAKIKEDVKRFEEEKSKKEKGDLPINE